MEAKPLRFNYEFSRVYRRGTFATGRVLTVHAFRRPAGLMHNNVRIPGELTRVGFCANKKQLGAVGRNRARRLMRESYRLIECRLKPGYDLVFTLRSVREMPSYEQISREMDYLLGRLKMYSSETDNGGFSDKTGENVSEIHKPGTGESL